MTTRHLAYRREADGSLTPVDDLMEMGELFEPFTNRLVRQSHVPIGDPEAGRQLFVSTVFLVLDHGWGDGPPVLWETMVFDGEGIGRLPLLRFTRRYTTEADAIAGHEETVFQVLLAHQFKQLPEGEERA